MIDIINGNGTPVRNLQVMLRAIGLEDDILPEVIDDGIFDEKTKEAVIAFQKRFDLEPTGEVDIITFEKIVEEYNRVLNKET